MARGELCGDMSWAGRISGVLESVEMEEDCCGNGGSTGCAGALENYSRQKLLHGWVD